jgi:heme exporter protein C
VRESAPLYFWERIGVRAFQGDGRRPAPTPPPWRTATGPAAILSRRRRKLPIHWGVLVDTLTALAVLVALYAIFIGSPAERVQGDVFRIFYVHVALAWLAYVAYALVFVGSVSYLWRGWQGGDRLARAAAELGVLCTTLVLVTGSLWGRPVWGVWWTWDARLTTTLVLWFLYVGYLMVRSAIVAPRRAARVAAVAGIAAFVDVPIVQLSVTWWRTLHPAPSVGRPDALAPAMLLTLALTVAASALVFGRLLSLRLAQLRARAELERLVRQVAELEDKWSA